MASSKKAANRAPDDIASDSDISEDEDERTERGESSATDDNELPVPHTPEAESLKVAQGQEDAAESTSVVEDVIGRKGQYGRFADRWFSKKGWSMEKKRMQGMSTGNIKEPGNTELKASGPGSTSESQIDPHFSTTTHDKTQLDGKQAPDQLSVAESLVPKLLRTTKMLLGSHSFYFAYDYDITRRLGTSQVKSIEIPLYKSIDPLVR